jgi:hypothetical protein
MSRGEHDPEGELVSRMRAHVTGSARDVIHANEVHGDSIFAAPSPLRAR